MNDPNTQNQGDFAADLHGISIATLDAIMPIASIDVWFSDADNRGCRVLVYDGACEVELLADGQRLLSYRCPSVAAALNQAEQWRPAGQFAPKAAA